MSVQAAPVEQNSHEWPYRFEVVRVDNIYIDRFQRPLNERWLKEREGRFDPAMVGAVVLSERTRRGKEYSGVDGQHRIELCRRESIAEVLAVVFHNLTIEQEAELFSRFQQERRAITPYQRFKADLVAGNQQARAIERIVREEGLELSESGDGPGYIKCIRALEKVYEDDPAMLRQVLRLVQGAWGMLPYGRAERLIKGVWLFARNTDDLDEDRFIDRLGQTAPSALFTRAQQLRDGAGRTGSLITYMRETVENEYRRRPRR